MERQEIISELNELIHVSPVRYPAEAMKGLKDALSYIESQPEPVKPEPIKGGSTEWWQKLIICSYKCPVCGGYIAKGDKHCDCGRELTWEGV